MAEHARIAHYFAPLCAGESGSFNLTDDAAALTVPPGKKLVVTTDSVIAGIHVLPDATAQQIAMKLMRRNLSDLAAMGAVPWRYTLNLHSNAGCDEAWFAAFAQTLRSEQEQFGLVLVGGDSTSGGGPVHATMTCFGLAENILRRKGANIGDELYVSGTIGDAALALHFNQLHGGPLAQRYHAPTPRLALGAALHGLATACIDIADGLYADAAQLAQASGVALEIAAGTIPLSAAAKSYHTDADFFNLIGGGDDYELLFTAPSTAANQLQQLAQSLSLKLTKIGVVIAGNGVTVHDGEGNPITITSGFSHT